MTSRPHVGGSPATLIGGRYRVLEELGRGGTAVVYRVHDVGAGRELALKQLMVEQAAALFEREYYALAQLAHPRVIAVYDYGLEQPAASTPWSCSTAATSQGSRAMPWRQACRLLCDVCSALSLLHSRRLVHRDVTPRNIRCTHDGTAKLIDFGAMAPFGPVHTHRRHARVHRARSCATASSRRRERICFRSAPRSTTRSPAGRRTLSVISPSYARRARGRASTLCRDAGRRARVYRGAGDLPSRHVRRHLDRDRDAQRRHALDAEPAATARGRSPACHRRCMRFGRTSSARQRAARIVAGRASSVRRANRALVSYVHVEAAAERAVELFAAGTSLPDATHGAGSAYSSATFRRPFGISAGTLASPDFLVSDARASRMSGSAWLLRLIP